MHCALRILAIVALALMAPNLKAQDATNEGQNLIQRIGSEFPQGQLDELLATAADTDAALRLNLFTQSLSAAELSLIALAESQHLAVRLYALRDLQFRYFSAWKVEIELLRGLTQIYSNQQTDWRLRVFAAGCLARWFSKASYDADVQSSEVQFATGSTVVEVTAELETAVASNAALRKQKAQVRSDFIDLVEQEIELLIQKGRLKGTDKVRLDKAMTQARLLGDPGFIGIFSKMANSPDLRFAARQGAVQILGEIGDSQAWEALQQYYESNRSGSYYDRRIALSAMHEIDAQRALRFIQQTLQTSIADNERHDLEYKYMDYALPNQIERLLGSRYGPIRAAIVRKDWPALEKALRQDDGDISDSLVKFLTRNAVIDPENQQAILQLFNYLVSSSYAPGSIGWTRLHWLSSGINDYQSLLELDNSALSSLHHTLLRVLERPGHRYVHQYLEWTAMDVMVSGRIPGLQLPELLQHINNPRYGKSLANRLAEGRRYSPSQIIHSLPANLDRRGASNVVRLLEGEGWDLLPEILAALDSRVIAIARTNKQQESSPFPQNQIESYREVLSLQIIIEQVLQGLPKSALPLLVDHIASENFRRPISNIAETLKLTLAESKVVTLPILTTLLGGGLSISSHQFLSQILVDQGPLALEGIKLFLESETPDRLSLVSDITSAKAFRRQLTPPQQNELDEILDDVSFTILKRRIKATFTRVFVDEIVGFGMLIVVLTAFRRAIYARARGILNRVSGLLRYLIIKLVKPSIPTNSVWMPGFVVRSKLFWQELGGRKLSDQQLETIALDCKESGSAVVDAAAAWAIRAEQVADIANLHESNSELCRFVAELLISVARQDPAHLQSAINAASVSGSIEITQARDEFFKRYVEPRKKVLKAPGLSEEKAASIRLELQRYSADDSHGSTANGPD